MNTNFTITDIGKEDGLRLCELLAESSSEMLSPSAMTIEVTLMGDKAAVRYGKRQVVDRASLMEIVGSGHARD